MRRDNHRWWYRKILHIVVDQRSQEQGHRYQERLKYELKYWGSLGKCKFYLFLDLIDIRIRFLGLHIQHRAHDNVQGWEH